MKKTIVILCFACFGLIVQAQSYVLTDHQAEVRYEKAFKKLSNILAGKKKHSFKEAVFLTEQAYFGEELTESGFNAEIALHAGLCREIAKTNKLDYEEADYETIMAHAAIFKLLTDTLLIAGQEGQAYLSIPFRYDFEDIWGHGDWSTMFVTKLLATHTGNCHSLPFLYKILAEELGEKAWIAAAPNHFYIKIKSKKFGWYNTELTSGEFPIDAWLMASGYVHLSAIQNSMYMDTLSREETLALCMIDLAQGYEKKCGLQDGRFILTCCDKALEHYPQYANGLLFRVETKRKLFFRMMDQAGATHPSEIFHLEAAKTLFDEMEQEYRQIHELGYRRMPESMYMDWLTSLKTEQKRFQNQKIQQLQAE